MAMREGLALRREREAERIANEPCPCCGHKDQHREAWYDRWEVVDGEPVQTMNPDYVAGVYFCGHDGCDCKVRVENPGRNARTVAA